MAAKRSLEKPNEPKVKICFKAQDGSEVYYRIRADAKIQKAITTYCREKNFVYGDVRFLFDGRRLGPNQTPIELDMCDGDHIDVMIHQHGGGHHHHTLI